MIMLISGLVLWSGMHFLPSLGTGLRARLIARFGEKTYLIVFSAGIVISIVLMVLGWMAMPAGSPLYRLPGGTGILAVLLMAVALILFAAARSKSNIRHYVRHPQLSSIAVWGVAHLLSNAELRAVILFGTLAIWAIAEIIVISRREGVWSRPLRQPLAEDLKPVLIGLVLFAVLMAAHPYLFSVSPIPGS